MIEARAMQRSSPSMTNPIREALEAARRFIENEISDGDLLSYQIEDKRDALAKIDAALSVDLTIPAGIVCASCKSIGQHQPDCSSLSAVPAPVSEEEIAQRLRRIIAMDTKLCGTTSEDSFEVEGDIAKEARAILSRLSRTEGEWRPIETAPKDGSEVIVFCPKNRPQVFTAAFVCGEWGCSVEDRCAPKDDFYGDSPKWPTHWMPLPSPPRANNNHPSAMGAVRTDDCGETSVTFTREK